MVSNFHAPSGCANKGITITFPCAAAGIVNAHLNAMTGFPGILASASIFNTGA